METSPRELRDIEIREAFRGYHRDDVNELLERAAATIEALTDRVRELGDRLAAGTATGGADRTRDLEEMLERTLLLAKRTADEEVAEASAKARQLVDDAEAKAHKLVLDAEVDARRRSEEEHGRIQRELIDLAERRDTLSTAVEELDRFESEYRERLLRSIEGDLAVIGGRGAQAPGPIPQMPEVVVPPLPEAIQPATAAPDDSAEGFRPVAEAGAGAASAIEAQSMLEAAAAKAAARHDAETRTRETVTEESTASFEAAAGNEDAPPATEEDLEAGQIDLLGEEAVEAEIVDDDDEFFSQLRDAVSDEQPSTEQEAVFFDQEGGHRDRELFRRRG